MAFAFPTFRAVATLAVAVCAGHAQAHVSYTGRNFGTFDGVSSASVTISNQTVTGNWGWADATDATFDALATSGDTLRLGDTHKARAFRFHLDTTADVTFAVSAKADATATSVGGLLPGFSVHRGLAAISPYAASQTALASSADYDYSAATTAWRTSWAQANIGAAADASATMGAWNAMGDFAMGGDGDLPGDPAQLSMFLFQVFVNVGMNVGIMPITGVPLPLMSYGGSSILTTMVAIGLLQSIHAQARSAAASKGRVLTF